MNDAAAALIASVRSASNEWLETGTLKSKTVYRMDACADDVEAMLAESAKSAPSGSNTGAMGA